MKHLSASVSKLLAVAACALTLGSCQRAEYAFLPKTSSYHGVARVAAPVPAEPAAASVAPTEKSGAAVPTPPANTSAEVTVVAPVAPKIAAAAVAPTIPEAKVTASAASATVVVPTPIRKLSLAQRLAVAKVSKQIKKATELTQFKQKQNTAETQRVSGNLRTGLILLVIGAILGIIPNLGLVGFIVVLIGVLFIVLWLLDNL